MVLRWNNFSLDNWMPLDLQVSVKGLEHFRFDECGSLAVIADLGPVTVPFLHINDLIDSKKVANRIKDQTNVIYLEKIKRLMQEAENK